MSTFPHHQQNGCWVSRPLTTKPRIDRITTPNARTRYKGEGITLGATVSGFGIGQDYRRQRVTGQVWSKGGMFANPSRYWWVVTPEGAAFTMHESDMTVVSQCGSLQGDLFEA